MKKIIALFALVLAFTIQSKAQNAVKTMYTTVGGTVTTATVTNTATGYVYVMSEGGATNIGVQAVITKTSGTIAGTYYLQGSLDGTNYKSIVGDSVTATNVTTNTYVYRESNKYYKYYRIAYTGSGTMVGTLQGYYFPNNPYK